MKNYNEYKDLPDDDEESDSGSGSTGTEVVFRLPDLVTQRRDDLLPPEETKRLLLVEQGIHKALVDKQKLLMQERKKIKEGGITNAYDKIGFGQGGYAYETSSFKKHYISDKAQFSGSTDRKVVGVPDLTEAETNKDNKNELKNNYDKKLRLDNVPRQRPLPKPTPFS